MDRLAFGVALRQERTRQGLSLTALARLVHYSKRYLSRVETGRNSPTRALAQICDQALSAEGTLAMLVAERARIRTACLPQPAQLPAAVAGFTGRASALAELETTADGSAITVVISAIGGMAGIGKTALAVHFAHQVASRFPDGQLYVNLHGFDPSEPPLDPAAAIRSFLDAMQIPAARIPPDPDAQAALYRSLLAGRRVLVLADNARDAAQVRPLLPGTPGCLVLVTSRHQMAGLAATDDARLIGLDVLTEDEAHDLLSTRIGRHRVAAEPSAAGEIATACGRLPLALAIVAARAAARPRFPLRELAAELAAHQLDALAADSVQDTDLRVVFSWSYRALNPQVARLFRLLGLHPGPAITAAAAASLAGLPPPQARTLLGELADAHLISEPLPGRYVLHDLLRAYAVSLASQHETQPERRAATHRIVDHYLHTSRIADNLIDPLREPIILAPPHPGVTPEDFAGPGNALAWFSAERAILLATVQRAASDGFDAWALQLAWVIWKFLDRRGHWHDLVAIQRTALTAARRIADSGAQASIHRILAKAFIALGLFDDARAHLQDGLNLHLQSGDQVGQAHYHLALAALLVKAGRHCESLVRAGQALDLYRAAGDLRGQARALNNSAWSSAHIGDLQQALRYSHQALPLYHQLGDRPGQALGWDSLAYAHHHLGHYDRAAACYQRALNLFRECGDRYHEAETLTHLGDTRHAAGDAAAARETWGQALTILDDLDDPDAQQVRAKLITP